MKKHASKLSQEQYLEIMLIEMQQIQSTINNYLSLTKPQNTLKEKIDINHIFKSGERYYFTTRSVIQS